MRARHAIVAAALAAACGNSGDGGGDDPAPRPAEARGLDPEPAAAAEEPPAPEPIEHAAFDLVDNRLLADRVAGGGLYIDASAASFPRYIRFHRWVGGVRWTLDAHVGDTAVARPARDSELSFVLDADQAAAFRTLTLRVHADDATTLHVSPNRDQEAPGALAVRLAKGWNTVEVALPEGALTAGSNRLSLRKPRYAELAFQWMHLGPAAPAEVPGPLHDREADALVLAGGDALVYHLFIPEGASLRAEVLGDGCAVDAAAVNADGKSAGGELRGDGRVDLSDLGGGVARLELRASGCARAGVRARLMVPGPRAKVHDAPPPKYVVLWVMDTLRADRVRTVTPGAQAEIPNLEKLAANGAVFRQYYVQGNESQTSHSSVWTSLYPINHKVITSGPTTNYILSNRFDAIGKVMHRSGFRTVGVTSNGTVFGWSGYTKGFDVFNNVMKDGTGRKLGFRVPGDVVFERAVEKVGEPDGPLFLFIGTTDTHKPWYGHEPWLSRYDPDPYKGPFADKVLSADLDIPKGTHICKYTPPPRQMKRIMAIYDSDVSFQDAQVGRLLEQLEAWGIADETMLIITADHGEELWEYPRRCGHGSSMRETLVHVPLLVYYPPLIPHAVVDVGADGVDILPTVIDAIGGEPIDQAQGESLVPLAQGVGLDYPRPSYATMNDWAHTVRMGRWKLKVTSHGKSELYDRDEDPYEHHDLAAERPLELAFLRDAAALLVYHRKAWKKSLWGVSSNMTARGAAELEGTWDAGETDANGG